MPLHVDDGIQITPQAPPQVIELSPTDIQPANNSFNMQPNNASALRRFSQERSEWCWAACAQMVATFYNRSSSQCRLASFLFDEDGCCESDLNFNSACNQGCDGDDVVAVYDRLGIGARRLNFAAQFADVVSEIKNGQPVEAGLKWLGDQLRGGHLVIIYGFSPSANAQDGWIRVNDPWDEFQPQSEIKYSYLRAAYGMGRWSDTWVDIVKQV